MNGIDQHIAFVRPPTDRVNLTLGWVVFLFTLIVYGLTRAVTVPFWDCGEFITCAYILGVPHPPGTPLYILLGRIFTMFPLIEDISGRVNFLSGVCSAGTAMVGYFILTRLICAWHSPNYAPHQLKIFPRLSVYAGALSGALFLAFSSTNWVNSVEAEVYGASMFLFLTLIWLALVWYERRTDYRSDKYLIAISYLAILAVGIHMTVFLAMPPIFLLIILTSPRLRRDWRFWVSGVVLFLVVHEVNVFLWPLTVWLLVCTVGHYWPAMRRGWIALPLVVLAGGVMWAAIIEEPWPVYLSGLTASLFSFVIFGFSAQRRLWALAHGIILAGIIGYTVQAYIPIRSAHDPVIDENDPETWTALKNFLERKQYGRQSMFERALTRRGEWANQFGQHRRMGFWGFFDRQYGYKDYAFFPFFILGLFGLGSLLWRCRRRGAVFLLILFFCSVGLIWYMNFADGTKYDPAKKDAYLEVRDRDYFYTPAFILFGMAMGLGIAGLISMIGASAEETRLPAPLRFTALAVGGALSLLPLKTLLVNYPLVDRSRDYIPFDYAYNILQSADEGAVLFTNGDNDTFPVWCLQEVYGIRRDVKVANLSLINTHWYIKQLKHRYASDSIISYTDEQIDRLSHVRTPEGEIYRLQDRMIDDILNSNRWRLPINFAITVPESNRRYQRRGLEKNLMMIGMAYRVVADTGTGMVDHELMHEKFWNVFKFRSINDPRVHKTESARRLVANYASGFLFIADAYRKAGDYAAAEREVRRAIEVMPAEWQPYVYLAQLASDIKKPEYLEPAMEQALASAADLNEVAPAIYYCYERLGDRLTGQAMLSRVLEVAPHATGAFQALIRSYYQDRNYEPLMLTLRQWVSDNPVDTQSTRMLGDLEQQLDLLEAEAVKADSLPDTLTGGADSGRGSP